MQHASANFTPCFTISPKGILWVFFVILCIFENFTIIALTVKLVKRFWIKRSYVLWHSTIIKCIIFQAKIVKERFYVRVSSFTHCWHCNGDFIRGLEKAQNLLEKACVFYRLGISVLRA